MKLVLLSLGFLAGLASGTAFAQKKKRTRVVPEVTYRQIYLEEREDSAQRRTTQKDYTDQVYLSLKMVKTFNFVNEIVIEPSVRTPRTDPGADPELNIDQGYIESQLQKLRLTGGRKAEYEGTGYFVNPSDLLNEDKDLFDPLYQKEGEYFTRVSYQATGSYNLSLGFIPARRQSARFGKTWLQMGGDMAGLDWRMQYTYNFRDLSSLGLSASVFTSDWFELHVDSRYQQRQRTASEQEERIIFDCAAVDATRSIASNVVDTTPDYEVNCLEPTIANDEGAFFTVLGSRFVLTAKRTVIVEAIQNQGGLTPDEQEMYFKYVRLERDGANIEPEPQTRILGRQYWFLAYQDEDTLPQTTLGMFALYNQLDQSTFLNGEIRYTVNPIATVGLVNTQFLGDQYSEFGEVPVRQATYLIFTGRF